MGTTITALLADGPRLGLAHVGDSRAYLFRDGVLSQLSHDHSYVQQLVDDGRLSEADAEHHPQRNLLTRSLDGRDAVEPDLVVHEARVGDRYLLCTDGLSGVVRADQLTEALALPTPEEAKDRLIELALGGGAPDNVTCIVADIVEADGASGATTGRVLAGAAGDTEPGPGPAPGAVPSAAALAAEDADRPRPPRRRRGLVIALGTLLVLAVGCGVGWAYVQSQYYVGADHDHVAIYRGVEGKVAGVSLSSVSSQAPVLLSDLPAFEQDKVRDGISATGLGDARSIVDRLTAEASPSPTPAPLPTTKPTPSTKPCASPLPKSTVAKPTVPGTPCPTLRASAKPTVATR
jgi:protein phosphatase